MEIRNYSVIYGVLLIILFPHSADCQCTWPSAFVSSTWRNNARGNLVFSTTTMTGWSFTVGSQVVNEWQCVSTDSFESDGYLLMRSVNDFIQFVSSHYYAYLCLKMTAITDVSYRVYVQEPQQPNLDYDRFLIHINQDLTEVSQVCYEQYGAIGSEYQVMIKSGSELSAIITCPWIFLGRFDYTHTSVSSSQTCTGSGDEWDLCSDKTQMAFDFNSCSTDVAYSAQSVVHCVDTIPVNSDAVVTVYTAATVDDSSTFSFACFAVSSGLAAASVAPEFCREGQTSSALPTDRYGSQIGAQIAVTTVYELCPTCPNVTNPDGGSVSVETDGPWTVALYTCAASYALYGDANRTCQQNNSWSGTAPSCKCIAPASPDNGGVTVSSDGSLATYTCDAGFVLTGNEQRVCQTDGNAWNGTDPTCETCNVLGNPSNGGVTLTQLGSTSLATFSCSTGYSLNGEANITCLVDGTWSGSSPTCVLCSSLTAPDLGNVSLSWSGVSTMATFVCTSGYQIQGVESLTCDSSGAWDNTEPSCICESRAAPSFGAVAVASDGLTSSYACNVGYSMVGAASSTCNLDGSSWDTAIPQCVACANLTTPSGGNITLTTNGTVTMATFTCEAGYNMVGEAVSVCSADGTWSQASTACVQCSELTSPNSGSVNVTSDGSVSTAVYTCVTGYLIVGTSQRTCKTDGMWNGTEPNCDCAAPSTPSNGNVIVTGSLAVFTCHVNYTLSGESVSSCKTDGTGWNSSEPTCVPCANLVSPVGGSVEFVSDSGLSTTATYRCLTGYTLSGDSSVTCSTDGTWSSTATTCVQCGIIVPDNGGTITLSSNGSLTEAAYSCSTGYTLSGDQNRTCGSDGQWSGDHATCTTCQSLGEILSGQVTTATNGTATMATYTCVTDYQLVGSSSRICLPDGTWTETAPECICDDPANISDGSVSVSADGLTATYQCNTGYTMDGTSTLTCQTNGTGWSTSPPTCVACQSLADTANGSLSLTTDGVITIVTYTCDTGYSVNGTTTRSCQTDGQWTSHAPNCVSCASLTDPSSGSFSLSFNGTNSQALLTCASNYSVVGSALLTCLSDGSWDADTPSCVCDVPVSPASGSVLVSDDGYTAVYTCLTGFTLSGITSRTCQSDGQSWSGQAPTCVQCGTIIPDSGGTITLSSNGSLTEAAYSCSTGYTLSGDQNRTCGSDGQWSGHHATCTACASLQDPDSGSVTLSTDNITSTASYRCSTGYYLHGSNVSQCNTDGSWTNPAPTCVCVPPSAPSNGSMTVSTDNMTLTFTCDTGFILSGSSERVCQADGTGWNGSQPTCTTCASLVTPDNGTVTLTSDGMTTTAEFTCNVGFTLHGTSVLTCTAVGSWDTESPLCVACPGLADIPSGSVAIATNGTRSVASFTCVTGYSVVGNSAISCLTSGAWDGEIPTCVCNVPSTPTNGAITVSGDGNQVSYECTAGTTLSGLSVRQCNTDGTGWQGTDPQCVSCPALTTPNGGTVNTSSDGQFTYAEFTCDLSYSINGLASLTCTAAGTWDNEQPSCVQCSSLTSPSSGSVVTSTSSTTTVANFICVAGYTLTGNSLLTCQSNGTWDTDPPTCVCSPPSTPVNGAYELSNDAMSVTYTCSTGYTLLGVSTRACQTDGSGWNEAQPSCTTCDPLNSFVGGDITMATSGTVTQAVFTCDTGYTISGDTNLTCRSDGTWDISAPTCEVCDSLSSPAGGSVQVTSTDSVSVATYSCNLGYTLSGPVTLTCRTDGSWNLGAPTCTQCSALTSPDSGTVTLTTNNTITMATISCVTGYSVSGESVITCGSDGSWSADVPSCVCSAAPVPPANGNVTLSADNRTATFTCDVGNSLVGSSTSVCATDGTGWTTATPTCVSCPVLTSVNGGNVDTVSDGITTTSSVTCSIGATVSGAVTITCQSDGSWTDSQPACVQCSSLTSPDNGNVTTQTNGTITMATYSCDVGYTMAGDSSATCLANGSWDITPPTCELCETLGALSSGSTVISTNGIVTMATFSCSDGYFLSGDQTMFCQQDGTWNSSQPACVCDEPSAPVDGSRWISADGMSAVFYCNTGFTISGAANNTCATDGTGWTSPHPTCVECQGQVAPVNGNISQYTDGTATHSVYTCEEGYSLSNTVSIATCTDSGQWDQSSLSCVQCSSLAAPSSGTVQISTNGSASLATYSCLQGYSLQGNNQRTCQTDGTWNGTDPTCVCNSPSSPSNGAVTLSTDQLTANFTCDSGYSLNGVSVRLCAGDGTGWTDSVPSCVPCDTLTTVSGGSVALSSDGQTTMAEVTCDTGYTIAGSPTLQCRSDGTWNVSSPNCVLCGSLTVSSDGSYSLASDGQSTTVTFQCETGFTLSGSASSTCTTAGTWTLSEPTCVSCGSRADPDSGSVTVGTNGTATSATYMCDSGYHIVGESVLYCTDSGTWSNTEPICVCDEPATPANGTVVIGDNGYTATYSCTEGYSLSGSDVHMCSTNGTGWNGTDPTCVLCSEISAPANGSVVMTSDGTVTYVTVGCDVGYTASSSINLTCQTDGSYDLTVPTCESCNTLLSPDNGSLVLSTTGSVTMATFSCDLGYSLAGNQLLTCQTDGSWSDAPPTCELCDNFQNISSGSFSLATNTTITTATVQCVTGYVLNGSETVHCTQSGTWTDLPVCLCEDPAAPNFGHVTADGYQAVFTCDQGYTLNGDTMSTCQSDGSGWDKTTPTCVLCETQSTIEGGASYTDSNGSATYVTYTCPVGYSLSGESEATCGTDGQWSASVPSCTSCVSLDTPDSGLVTRETNNITTEAVYSCVSGYDLIGVSVRTCLANGTWTNSTPSCACSVPETPLNGALSVSSDRTTITYSCSSGYTLAGVNSRTCQIAGAGWTGSSPICTVCSTLSVPSGGNVVIATDGTMTTAAFTCNQGYTIDGETTLACRDDGSWNTSTPSCVQCESVATVTGGGYSVSTDGQTSSTEFTCNAGYTLVGTSQLTCLSSGQWSGQAPSCISCPSLAAPDSGYLATSTNGTSAVAVFTCMTGYYLYGSSNLTCLTTGQWDTQTPECRCVLPSNITAGTYTVSLDDSLVTYTCEQGYSLNGSQSRMCQETGLGWTGNQPICVQCQSLDSVSGRTAVTTTNGSVTMTTYQCDVGSSLSGAVNSECGIDGTWTAETPTCVSCPELVPPDNGNVTKETNGTVSVGMYTCDLGYTMDGTNVAFCQTDGSWSSGKPSCTTCPSLGSVDSGSVILTTDGTTTSATHSCVTGYQLTGQEVVTCRSDSTWDAASPTCVCTPPLSLVNGNYTISVDGMSVTYTCNVGFSMTGSPNRSCDSAGAGWTGNPPTCAQCESLSGLDNGDVTYSTDGESTTVSYSCGLGYSISDIDLATATCTNGTWITATNTTPSCISCATLDTVTNGNITIQTDGAYSVATYSCLPDYTLTGDSQRTCAQGQWNGTSPSCLCTYSTFLLNGNAVSNGSVIAYTCNSGYTLVGTSTRTCQEGGVGWSETEPTCVVCDTLSTPTGGNMTLTTDGALTVATFTCDIGYSMTGQSTLTCRTDGTWSSSLPTCGSSCSALSQPVGGSVVLGTDGLVTTALHTCNVKYTLVGVAHLTCRSDGSWDYTQPACVDCGDLSAPASGYIEISTDGATSTANYSCHGDYYLEGSDQGICLANGSWSITPPSCICSAPPAIANGSVTLSEDKMTVTFSCGEGYTLNGNSSTSCQTDATGWSPYAVQCVSCGNIPEVSNRTSTISTDGQVTTLSFTCDVGYSVNGVASISCLTNGSWETAFPDCVGCEVLDSVANGSYTLATDGHTSTAQFVCDLGLSLKGDNLLSCSSDGDWNASVPECVACPAVEAPSSGFQLQSTDGITSLVSFSCETGYHLVGDTTLACQIDGTWNSSVPLCVCDVPSAPANGSVSVLGTGMTVQYSCDTGSTLAGEAVRQCSDNGTGWLNSPPTCVQCEGLSTVGDGSYTLSSDGTLTVATYTCQSGYSLSGSTQVTCTTNGTWEVSSPNCLSCVNLDDPSNGNVTIATNGTLTSAEYTCDPGYTLQGEGSRICTDLGTWDGEQPQCLCTSPSSPVDGAVSSDGVTATYTCDVGFSLYGESVRICQNSSQSWNGSDPQCISCQTVTVPSHGAVVFSSDGSTTTAAMTCDTGYTLSGTAQLTCRADGTWDFTEPSCVACSSLANPASGYVNISTNGSITVAQYTCLSDYHINGETTRTCDNEGAWSGVEPTCICDAPLIPPNASLVLSSNESIATFTCDNDFNLVGSAVLTCESDGTGWKGTEPICVQCSDFDPSFNGTVTTTTDGQTTLALLTCDLGSTLTGSASIACQEDGTWLTQSTLSCVTCEELQDVVGGTVTMTTNGTETIAQFTCNSGYSMNGSSSILCMNSGEWSGVAPSCVLCSSIVAPSSGSLAHSTDNYTTVVMATCTSGYHVVGSNPITCLSDGTWSNDVPSCVCDAPSSPVNGTSVISDDGNNVTFTCDVGFTLVGDSGSTCRTDGTGWDNSVPVCVQCSQLSNITGGFVTTATDGAITAATYTCVSGYSLHGDRVRECTTNGSWTLSAPECVLCSSLEAPSSGYLNITTNGTISAGYYTCDSGYDLQGGDQRFCQTNGTWTSTQPYCVCQLPATPDNGEVSFGSDVAIAQYNCNVGYTLQGAALRHCQNDGSGWNNTAPVCVACVTLTSSAGAVSTISTDGATSTVQYSCDLGYTMSGSANLTCRDDGTWDMEAPTCVSCGTLSSPQGGQINLTSDGSSTQAYISCDSGYTVSGTTTLTCRSDGTWDFTVPDCVQCPTLASPFGGSVAVVTDGHTTTATYTCLSVYYLEGSPLLTCKEDGNWNDTEPSCKCNPPPAMSDGTFEISADGTSVAYTCQSGYTLNGDSNRTCLDGGAGWSGTQPSCSVCEALTPVVSGSYNTSTDGLTTSVTYSCDTGHTLSGQSEARCWPNGSWEFEAPVCELCVSLATPGNGSSVLTSNGTVTAAVFECDSGYTLQGQAEVTCSGNGSWAADSPTCVSCPALLQPDNGEVAIATNGTETIAMFSCDTGYSLSGTQKLTCTVTGAWDNTVPTCECDAFVDPANGQMVVSDNGTTAAYTCDQGYTLVGEVTQTCNSPGNSNVTAAPSCEACATLGDVPGATITMTTDGTTSYATVQCDNGYTISGQTNLTCRSDGTWDVNLPSCVVCNTIDVPESGTLTLTSAGSVTVASITCNLGFTLKGSQSLTCRADGSWDFSTPSCSNCPSVNEPPSGNVTLTTDGHVTSALYVCEAGYYLDGTANITCNSSGLWETDPPVCKCTDPPSIDNGTFVVSANGSTVQYSCEQGYSLSGHVTRSCDLDGNGWDGNSPVCVKCADILDHANGTVSVTTDGVTTTTSFSCDEGFTLNGASSTNCLANGTWDSNQPTCDYCSQLNAPNNGTLTYVTNNTTTMATVQCDVGFTATGSSEFTCLAGGVWDTTVPTCVQCPDLSSPDNGNVVLTTNDSVTMAIYSCNSNYIIDGSDQLLCSVLGDWTEDSPTCACEAFTRPSNGDIVISNNGTMASYSCQAGYSLAGEETQQCGPITDLVQPSCVTCATLTASSGSSYSFSTNGSVTMATYVCKTGYTMIGQSIITCRTDGSWDSQSPSCVTCSTLSVPTGSTVNFTSSGEITQAQFICDNGYSLVGANTLTCRTDASWDFNVPACIDCPDLSDPSAGHVAMTTDGYTSVADFTCVAGYYVDGATQLSCNSSGMWNYDSPLCKCSGVVTPDNGTAHISTDGYSVIYTCEQGYTLNGTANRTCDSQGTGWSGQEPVCVSCENIVLSANLSVVVGTSGTETSASFTCDTGYSLAGADTAVCLHDGSWSENVPVCVQCVAVASLANGSSTMTSNGTTTLTSYDCEVGYTLVGEATLACNSSGTWSDDPPYCVSCAALDGISNGQVSITSNGTDTMATYSCDPGYSVHGYSVFLCTISGSWEHTQPNCVCDTFSSVANGNVTISGDGTGATYTCDEGYSLNGEAVITCNTPASTQNNTAPVCTSCRALDVPAGSTVTTSTDGQTTTATVQCGVGYVISGQGNLTCRDDGTWDVVLPSCVTCSTLSQPVGGTVSTETDGSTTTARFTCDTGYTLSGSDQLTCRVDGTWDLSSPTCVSCPNLVTPSSGNLTLSTDGNVTMATVGCFPGYYIDGSVTLTCTESGEWSGEVAVCKCDALPSIANGSVSIESAGFVAVYSCSSGYTLSGNTNRSCDMEGNGWLGHTPTCVQCNSILGSNNMTVAITTNGLVSMVTYQCDQGFSLNGDGSGTCGSDGIWTVQQPTCDQCSELLAPGNGDVIFSTNGTSTQAVFTCNTNYTLDGDTEALCQAGGNWSAQTPLCVGCAALDGINNWQVSITTNGTYTRATYSCDPGYSVHGYSVLLCTTSGSWEHTQPDCVCDTFTSVANGNLTISADGTGATYTCDEGYSLSGEAVITCNTPASTQNNTAPVCSSCEALDVPAGSTVTTSTDGLTTTATVQCGVGYVISGQGNLTCRDDGTWDVVLPSCVTCSTLSQPAGGTVSMSTDGSTTTARFTCDTGYTLSGSDQLTCRVDGTWDLSSPTCVSCPNLVIPSSGNLTLSTDGNVTMATISCFPGYYLDGSVTLTCTESGEWSGEVAVCKCDTLPSIANGSVSIESGGFVAVYSCSSGFTLSGNTNRSCDMEGNGWLGATPTCVQCSDIVASNNMTVTITTNGLVSMVTYQCDQGFSLNGDGSGTCGSDGIWTVQQPNCDKCSELLVPGNGAIVFSTNGTSTQAVFTCDTGYTLDGDTEALCQAGGIWSAQTPLCDLCPALIDPFNGHVVTSSNGTVTSATYTCSTGYSISGTANLTCDTGGTWSGTPPTCSCDVFLTPGNGNVSVSTDGTTATYSCNQGYSLSGEIEQRCTSSSSSCTTVSCVLCNTLPSSPGASILFSTNGTRTTATFTCDSGYKMAGTAELTCTTDGSWDIEPPICVVCETLTSPIGGSVNVTSDSRNTQASYTCVSGFTLHGQHTLSCNINGTWDFDEPTCVCNLPSTPDHGGLTMSGDGLTATYTCEVGYSMAGDSVLQCATNGSGWQGEQPTCVACPEVNVSKSLNVTLFTNGMLTRVVVLCEKGYSLSDTDNVTCQPNGSWNKDTPSCEPCPSLTPTSGLAFQLLSDGISTVADFSCASGYSLNGARDLQCMRNGTWDMTQPVCVVAAGNTEDSGCSSSVGAAIAFGVLFGICLILLLPLVWKFWRQREKLKAANKSNLYKSAPRPWYDKSLMSLPTLDEIVLSNAKAPLSHSRHVTDMGRADSSLAPKSHHRHVMSAASSISSSPAPRSHFGHPKSVTQMSLFTDSLKSSPLPQQLQSPRSDIDSPQSFSVPEINIDTMLPGRGSTTKLVAKSPGKLTPKGANATEVTRTPRDGSPLPQQILTPREPHLHDGASPYSVKRGVKKQKEGKESGASSVTIQARKRRKPRSTSPNGYKMTDASEDSHLSDIDC